jgi:hypothetical protein
MKRAILAAVLAPMLLFTLDSFGNEPLFEKVSDHCYYLQFENGAENVFAVITEEGILMVNPPQEPNLPAVRIALKNATSKAVRWVAFTDYRYPQTAGARFFAEQGALFVASAPLQSLAEASTAVAALKAAAASEIAIHEGTLANIPKTPSTFRIDGQSGYPRGAYISPTEAKAENEGGDSAGKSPAFRWLIFDTRMNLYLSDLEIRILALRHRARTGGDVVIHVPDEKVLFVGNLYEAARYPEIDTTSEGSALQWMDGMKQVLEFVPVLKPAIPPEEPESEHEEERTLEERITVVSAHGETSNLQNLKDLLEGCRKLERDISRSVRIGRSCKSFLASAAANGYYSYGNLESFAAQLFAALDLEGQPR